MTNSRSGFQFDDDIEDTAGSRPILDAIEHIIDAREWDVPYHIRVAIDKGIPLNNPIDQRHSNWEMVHCQSESRTSQIGSHRRQIKTCRPRRPSLRHRNLKITPQIPRRSNRRDNDDLIHDRWTSLSPPPPHLNRTYKQGFLITNREIVSSDIDDFDYTPKPEFEGPFTIINARDERSMLMHFFEHIQSARPTVIATYNGDFFDWPFVEQRAAIHGINMYDEIGFKQDDEGEYKSKYCAHMDCLKWVKRDSYLPQGSQGLKAVTTAKLGYDPLELDPEVMTKYLPFRTGLTLDLRMNNRRRWRSIRCQMLLLRIICT
jgi:DNA polymerase epsilon subunit 1